MSTKFIFSPKDDITAIELIRVLALKIKYSSKDFQRLIVDKLADEGVDPETVRRHFREETKT